VDVNPRVASSRPVVSSEDSLAGGCLGWHRVPNAFPPRGRLPFGLLPPTLSAGEAVVSRLESLASQPVPRRYASQRGEAALPRGGRHPGQKVMDTAGRRTVDPLPPTAAGLGLLGPTTSSSSGEGLHRPRLSLTVEVVPSPGGGEKRKRGHRRSLKVAATYPSPQLPGVGTPHPRHGGLTTPAPH